MATAVRPSGTFTHDDLMSLPDDSLRYELIDGVLLVNPSPTPRHQEIVVALVVLFGRSPAPGLLTYAAPLDVKVSDLTVLEPDLVVVAVENVGERYVEQPVLVVEILSPSTRRFDLTVKRDVYAEAGIPHYWVIDPDDGPRLTAWRSLDGEYSMQSTVVGQESFTAEDPFGVHIVPAELLDR